MFTKILTVAILVTVMAASAQAALVTFSLEWSGAGFQNSAVATGMITLDDALLPNPGDTSDWPGPVTALQITVSGARTGNGTFGMADFDDWVWDTGGGTLDLTTELVGQPTAADPWGTVSGDGGDFNFFNAAGSPSAPEGVEGAFDFVLSTNGGEGDDMELISVAPVTAPVPEPAGLGLIGLALLAMRKRR